MRLKFAGLAIVLSVFATSAAADLMVINGRYMVAKEDIRGYFYRDRGKQTVFDIRWSDWSTQYRCADEYDQDRVLAASLNFVIQIKEARSMDFGAFLDSEGFLDCQKF